MENLQYAELNGYSHQGNGGDEAEFYLHGLGYGELNPVIGELGKKGGKAKIPNIKLSIKGGYVSMKKERG